MKRSIVTLVSLTAALLAAPAAASAATQWVALTGSVGSNSSCSSPGYIGALGAENAINAAASGDTIHLCAGTWNTADTSTGEGFEYYDKNLTVEGAGQSNTIIDATGGTRPAIWSRTDSFASVSLTVRDLTIRNATISEDPGAIAVYGPLTIEDVTVRNSGGETAAVGNLVDGESLVIRRSTLVGQAAGAAYPAPLVYSQGSTTVEDSTLRDNLWEYGTMGSGPPFAGILLSVPSTDYDLSVDSSTFTNLRSACDTAIGANTNVSITNSTFTGNVAGNSECFSAHIVVDSGVLTMKNSTFAGNTGVRNEGYGDGELISYYGMTLGNNIIVGDPNAEATCQTAQGDRINDGGNVISDGTINCDDWVGGASPSLQTKVAESAIELGPLADNGGPTETMALGATSVARGAAIDSLCPATDQRGITRGIPCSSGAWQEEVPSGKPTIKQKGRGGKKSLRVRVTCGGTSPCQIRLTGFLRRGKGKLKPRTVTVPEGGKTVRLLYTAALKRSLAARGGKGTIRVRAKETDGGSASTSVRVNVPFPVTG